MQDAGCSACSIRILTHARVPSFASALTETQALECICAHARTRDASEYSLVQMYAYTCYARTVTYYACTLTYYARA
jgi:hypothetical protein